MSTCYSNGAASTVALEHFYWRERERERASEMHDECWSPKSNLYLLNLLINQIPGQEFRELDLQPTMKLIRNKNLVVATNLS